MAKITHPEQVLDGREPIRYACLDCVTKIFGIIGCHLKWRILGWSTGNDISVVNDSVYLKASIDKLCELLIADSW